MRKIDHPYEEVSLAFAVSVVKMCDIANVQLAVYV